MKQTDEIQQMIILSEGLNDYCKPLQQLGIHLFNVMINYDDNRQVYLCNNPLWVRDYYQYELYQSSFYDNKPSLFLHDEYSLWEEHSEQPIMQFGLSFYENHYGLTISRRREESTAFYFFSGSQKNPHLPQFFINNFSFLDRFISEFTSTKQELIQDASAVSLLRYKKGSDSPWGEQAVSLLQNQQQILKNKCNFITQEYLLDAHIDSPLFKTLSRRQKQVLYGLSQGHSAQEIADHLNISRRTVERHLSLLKNKHPNHSYIELILELLSAKPKELLLT
ncbi:helix-turn-helix transcriptional regulator [Legionella lytica]|uniref:Helix-turn-helix transcriptional regulator n=1 Tax=Legionella lytica TaxID=96232 RepID=A0ABW8D949_9GAMM